MKTQEKDSTKIIGKTISGVGFEYNRGVVLAFTDNTFLFLRASIGYENEPEISIDQTFDFFNSSSVQSELLTQEEFLKMVEDHRQKACVAQEEQEKREYERLKSKFGK